MYLGMGQHVYVHLHRAYVWMDGRDVLHFTYTLLLLMRSSTVSVGGLAECPKYTLHQAASCNGGLYLSHNFSDITASTASFPSIAAKNCTGTLIARIRQNTPHYR